MCVHMCPVLVLSHWCVRMLSHACVLFVRARVGTSLMQLLSATLSLRALELWSALLVRFSETIHMRFNMMRHRT